MFLFLGYLFSPCDSYSDSKQATLLQELHFIYIYFLILGLVHQILQVMVLVFLSLLHIQVLIIIYLRVYVHDYDRIHVSLIPYGNSYNILPIYANYVLYYLRL